MAQTRSPRNDGRISTTINVRTLPDTITWIRDHADRTDRSVAVVAGEILENAHTVYHNETGIPKTIGRHRYMSSLIDADNRRRFYHRVVMPEETMSDVELTEYIDEIVANYRRTFIIPTIMHKISETNPFDAYTVKSDFAKVVDVELQINSEGITELVIAFSESAHRVTSLFK